MYKSANIDNLRVKEKQVTKMVYMYVNQSSLVQYLKGLTDKIYRH